MEGWKLLLPRAFQPSSSPSPSTEKRRMRWVLEVALRSQSSVKCGLGLPASVSHEKCRFLNSTQRFELAGAPKFTLLQHWKLRLIVLFEFFFFYHKSILILPLITYIYTHLWKIFHETITFTAGNAFSIYGLSVNLYFFFPLMLVLAQ